MNWTAQMTADAEAMRAEMSRDPKSFYANGGSDRAEAKAVACERAAEAFRNIVRSR